MVLIKLKALELIFVSERNKFFVHTSLFESIGKMISNKNVKLTLQNTPDFFNFQLFYLLHIETNLLTEFADLTEAVEEFFELAFEE